jgi:hypothetical protein
MCGGNPVPGRLKLFRAKACPALDAGRIPLGVKETRQNKD